MIMVILSRTVAVLKVSLFQENMSAIYHYKNIRTDGKAIEQENDFLPDHMSSFCLGLTQEWAINKADIRQTHVTLDYLGNWKHPMADELKQAMIVRLKLKWARRGNITDCGIFAMRHVEMFWSNYHTSFDCGFSTNSEELKNKIEAPREKVLCCESHGKTFYYKTATFVSNYLRRHQSISRIIQMTKKILYNSCPPLTRRHRWMVV
ncbi:hypothetical protein R6Q59_023765 [Mikania micrantha]